MEIINGAAQAYRGSDFRRRLARSLHSRARRHAWAAAYWTAAFYEKHGFRLVSPKQKDYLLSSVLVDSGRYTPKSVALANHIWRTSVNDARG